MMITLYNTSSLPKSAANFFINLSQNLWASSQWHIMSVIQSWAKQKASLGQESFILLIQKKKAAVMGIQAGSTFPTWTNAGSHSSHIPIGYMAYQVLTDTTKPGSLFNQLFLSEMWGNTKHAVEMHPSLSYPMFWASHKENQGQSTHALSLDLCSS